MINDAAGKIIEIKNLQLCDNYISMAQLLLTDASGRTVKAISVNGSGYVNLDVTGLASGIYNYSLQVDGKFVESRKMEVIRNK